jgi:hypothetical protein
MQTTNLALAVIDTKTAIAGSYVSIKYTLDVLHPIDDTGFIKIVFRIVSDFAHPQFDDPSGDNYWSVSTTGDCTLDLRWDTKGHTRPWGKSLYLKVMGGYLDRGDTVTIIFGDRSKGSRGWGLQTFCEDTFEFKTLIDHIATYQFIEIEDSPVLRIIPGEPVKAVCLAPSQVEKNSKFNYYLKLEDYWGNPVEDVKIIGHQCFEHEGDSRTISITDEKTGLTAQSNPISVIKSTDNKLKYYWADFHGQTEESVGTNTIDDYFAFARDYARLDICGHQANDFQVTDEFWEKINTSSDYFNKPGHFVTFPGYEWSGNTPLGGDRNVYFVNNTGIISRSSQALIVGSKFLLSPTADKLFEDLANQEVGSFVFAHVGGRYASIDMHDENIEVAMEIHSAWGTFEWLLHDAFDRGYRVGICANSDGHKARPGASFPGRSTFGSLGGLTCVLAKKLDRENIAQAMHQRHFYATTGNRPIINLEFIYCDTNAIMGDILHYTDDHAELIVSVEGTAPIESIDVLNGRERIKTIRPYSADELGNRIKIMWSGAERRGRARKVTWDGSATILGNNVRNIKPINFWNPDGIPVYSPNNKITWKSITTGGGSGIIISLDSTNEGELRLETTQGNIECDLDKLGISPQIWEFGGIKKQIKIMRLPEERDNNKISFRLPVSIKSVGDNPIFIRVNQEDGHIAWTSPVYVISKDDEK